MWIFGCTDMRDKLFYNFLENFAFICQVDNAFNDGKCIELK